MRRGLLSIRLGRIVLFGGLGALGGCITTKAGFLLICSLSDHQLFEDIWIGWSVAVFTISYGMFGGYYGATPRP